MFLLTTSITGFSFIEMIITLLIIGILASAAIPIYQPAMLQHRYLHAKLTLLTIANDLEDYYRLNQTYIGFKIKSLPNQASNYYHFSLTKSTDTHFQLIAQPQQLYRNDQCGCFYLDQAGNKMVSGSKANLCWE